uniref:Carboxylic ester hydrolase n=1 Tax=Panagrolaimus davidi TaxID=227884 RepID=A0A914QRQ1_9BILA
MDWAIQMLILQLFFVTCAAAAATDANEKAFVKLEEYSASGFQETTKNGISANIFLGLPYAKPPINELRFEKPESLPITTSKVVDATKWPSPCHQVVDISDWGKNTSEDCLYFNVFTPANMTNKKLLPVFIFIHGGGFGYGYNQAYGYEYFVDNFISQDIIMVTLQYRLAHFGFLATPDHVINGNYGHFDQIQALKFINKNIAAFGGDPNHITVMGHSAGSISVHTLGLTPKAKGLFQQEIHMAGSDYCQFAVDTQFVFKHSKLISDAVGCNQNNTEEKKLCLKNVDFKRFWEVRKELDLTDFPYETKDVLYWTTVYDNDLFEGKEIDELQKVAEKRNILYGIDSGEGLLWTLETDNTYTNVFSVGRGYKSEERINANADSIKNFLRTLMSNTTAFSPAIQEEAIAKIFDFYKIGDEYLAENPLHYFEKYTELYTDLIMKVPMSKEIDAKLEYGFKNQYMFQFSYVRPQDRAIIGNLPGHGYFLLYFAGLEIYTTTGITHSNEDKIVQKSFAEMLGSFVKTGTPSYNKILIPKITKSEFAHMNIDINVSIGDQEFSPKLQFWNQLDKANSYDIIRDIPLKKGDDKIEL